ncbi:MAG: hypothetical protein IPM13_01910 [Phycisphaerales bacterium]|nr:hypothetical protein [Phycisphaerales bacterium]
MAAAPSSSAFPHFDRKFLTGDEDLTVIGHGEIGGKAKGLAFIKHFLAESCPPGTFDAVTINIPRMIVIATDVYEQFVAHNNLEEIAASDAPDERIGHAFLRGELPPTIVGDLYALMSQVHQPLAVRSSSLLEDALAHPFAGTYWTKMIPNNQHDTEHRFARLTEAIKLIWASTHFADARRFLRAVGRTTADERMAVIIQEVVGRRCGERFYPAISGVLRTFNYYASPPATPDDGAVSLALGLGKQIVDGGVCWTYAPPYPRVAPPVGSVRELLDRTQTDFWAVHMGPPPPYDPTSEVEYLVRVPMSEAEADGILPLVASTYDPQSDRLVLGTMTYGPRVLNFAPLLDAEVVPLNAVVLRVAAACKAAVGADVEIEFAVDLEPGRGGPARFGFLQVRPTASAAEAVAISDEDLSGPRTVVASHRVLGNGVQGGLLDVVYLRPEAFDAGRTRDIADELAEFNQALVEAGRPYLLIGFGRWGSSDSWLGVPVTWPQISGARAIVEATLPAMDVEPSQGSHFFHNLASMRVFYLTVHHSGPGQVDWTFLTAQPAVRETRWVRHVRLSAPLEVRVDARSGRGVVLRAEPSA